MKTSHIVDERISEVRREWNRSELLLKQAELLRAEVIVPAVNELRYAGRQLVDALSAMGDRDDEAARFLGLSVEHCRRARQDAVDASILFMSSTLEDAVRDYGHEALIKENPRLPEFFREMQEARSLVVESRGDRSKRAEIYDSIEGRLPDLIQFSETLRLPAKPDRRSWFARWIAWAALFAAVGAIAISLVETRSFRELAPVFQLLIAVAGVLLGYLFASRRSERSHD